VTDLLMVTDPGSARLAAAPKADPAAYAGRLAGRAVGFLCDKALTRTRVFDHAENRSHAFKALLLHPTGTG